MISLSRTGGPEVLNKVALFWTIFKFFCIAAFGMGVNFVDLAGFFIRYRFDLPDEQNILVHNAQRSLPHFTGILQGCTILWAYTFPRPWLLAYHIVFSWLSANFSLISKVIFFSFHAFLDANAKTELVFFLSMSPLKGKSNFPKVHPPFPHLQSFSWTISLSKEKKE